MRLSYAASFVVLLAAAATTIVASEAEPAIHLLAPAADQATRSDLLIPETALRLLSSDCAARRGTYAKYWGVDELDEVPQDAYPRLQLKRAYPGFCSHLRLRRRGDWFFFLASKDGKRWYEHGRVQMQLPARTYVGMWTQSLVHQAKVEAVLARPMLNGEPMTDLKIAHIGEIPANDGVSRTGDVWTISNVGYRTYRVTRERCPFVHTVVEGDFDLDVLVVEAPRLANDSPQRPADLASVWAQAGVMCRADLADTAAVAGMMTYGQAQGGVFSPSSESDLHRMIDSFTPTYGGPVWADKDSKQYIGRVDARLDTWDELVDSVHRLTAQLEVDMAAKAGVTAPEPSPATPATPEQAAVLDKARAMALAGSSGKILQASRLVDQVLDASPTSPEAHYTAAFVSTMLACQNLHGTFHERPRFLARPLSHLLLARTLAAPNRPADQLAEAWVMLACGYPLKAMGVLEEADVDSAETRALRMFITRDSTVYGPRTIAQAEPIEQLAWLWAAQYCRDETALERVGSDLLDQNRSPAFTPLISKLSISARHRSTPLAVRMAFARDAVDLLSCDLLDGDRRAAVGSAMAAALGVGRSDDSRQVAQDVAWAALRGFPDDDPADLLRGLNSLYEMARQTPARGAAVNDDGSTRWSSLGLDGFADLQRSLLIRVLFNRAYFVGYSWGVPGAGRAYCDAVADGLEGSPGAAAFFRGFGYGISKDSEAAQGERRKVCQSPFGADPAVRCVLVNEWRMRVPRADRMSVFPYPTGRGAWMWRTLDWAAGSLGMYGLEVAAAVKCLRVDPWSHHAASTLTWALSDPASLERCYEKAPYDTEALRRLAYWAQKHDDTDRAIESYRKLVELSPAETNFYSSLARLHAAAGNYEQAVEIVRRAGHRCDGSVGLTNLQGRAAKWLVKLNRFDEALAMGRTSSSSYSFMGLEGLAVALDGAGRTDEALDVYRKIAHRYRSGVDELLTYMLRTDQDVDRIVREMTDLQSVHADSLSVIHDKVLRAFLNARGYHLGGDEVLKRAFPGIERGKQLHFLMASAMYARDFPKALAYSAELAGLRQRTAPQLVWTYVAATLLKDGDTAAQAASEWQAAPNDPVTDRVVDYLRGRIDMHTMTQGVRTASEMTYVAWIQGVEAELRGDTADAIAAYKEASDAPASNQGRYIARNWMKRLQENPGDSTGVEPPVQ